ncbi:hypothetical protein QR680_016648 [Steinernema hermaphroditum]|uniref:Zinc finger protein unc-98 n=1 Tax=Steinernema hermaphroditum TaxID=289476 RepID=A0AA39HC81_9BILA|nr:hypothetical protein QR680_016648 [Steinernema hermaphroditum]
MEAAEQHSDESPQTVKEASPELDLDNELGEMEKAPETPKVEVEAKQSDKVTDSNGFTFYKCRFCGLTFNYMTTLKAHERVHDVAQPYTCGKCNESFHFMCELEYHQKQHEKQKGYKCECGRTFYAYTELLYHTHADEEPRRPPMPEPEALPVPSSSNPAADARNYPAPDFMTKGFEPKHPLRVYSDVRSKPYICQYCSKSYADSRGLANHMYSHRGERAFNPRSSRYLIGRSETSYTSPSFL